ncbi:MAG: hypothetical protein O3A33_13465 [Chloroflexi bacterium]|nr:hypothetical protein [Chloroflexota bacterium]
MLLPPVEGAGAPGAAGAAGAGAAGAAPLPDGAAGAGAGAAGAAGALGDAVGAELQAIAANSAVAATTPISSFLFNRRGHIESILLMILPIYRFAKGFQGFNITPTPSQ